MARPAVVDNDLGYNKILKEIQELSGSSLLIGIQEGTITHAQTVHGHSQVAGLSVAQYAAKNEFGAPGVPQRSFLRSTFDENVAKIENVIQIQYGKIIDGVLTTDIALKQIGQVVTGMVQNKIRSIVTPPNSPRTIALKGSSKPLIDFGQMFASIRYTIRKGK